MTKEQRIVLIEKLRAENDITIADMERRRAARELNGDYDELPVITKQSHVSDFFNPADAIADQLWQQRNQAQAPQQQRRPEDKLVTVGYLEAHIDGMIDASVGHIIEVLKPLEAKIAKLENELNLVGALARGEIRTIKGKVDAA